VKTPSNRHLGNLPAETTSFVGRCRELTEVKIRLSSACLVSLVGPGGVGKTRLAIRAATDLGRAFRGGAWLVELAEVREPGLLADAVLAALDLRDQAATDPRALLVSFLRDKELLLVVDNCEHLLGAAATLIDDVVRAAPGVRVVATSREPLSIAGEYVVPVPPLELPSEHGDGPLAQIRQNEAVTLFVERAVAASGMFELTSANQAAVVDVCRRLDGLPLAIELAAVRTRVLSVEQILDRLRDRFGLLTGGSRAALPRHQTLRTTIDWSYDLLTPEEQSLFRRLCVFAGRFTLEDVEATSENPALDLLSSLVDKSLVVKHDAATVAAYRLHETMREYVRLALQSAGEEAEIEQRCVDYFLGRCQNSALNARYQLVEFLSWMDLEIDNIRAVLQWCLAHSDLLRGLTLSSSLHWFWVTRATSEGARWFDKLLALAPSTPAPAPTIVYFLRGMLAVLQADSAAAQPVLHTAITSARDSGQLQLLAESLAMSATAENIAGDRATARGLLDEADLVASGFDEVRPPVAVLQALALNALFQGDLDTARAAATAGVRRGRAEGDLYTTQVMLINLGAAALIGGDLEEAHAQYTAALRIAQQIDDRVAQFYLIGGLACCAAASGASRLAAQLLGATETLRAQNGMSANTILSYLVSRATQAATAALGAPTFEAEFQTGARYRRDEAMRLALGDSTRIALQSTTHEVSSGLLREREAEVARLVADGLTNKQIGARLLISERTVESHVRNIMNKLGVSSRAQIAGWITSAAER
jgi:predicted ATPase/DNA-binding CsgD family transcriptional regulator